jgi:hypothetical protein
MELSFLTIVVSLAVCSLLIYAVFQYMKVRLNVLEQSQKEQALILQQFIEESSTDIHRLYKLSANNGGHYQPQGSIILEYANELVNENNDDSNQKQQAYNEPHIIHLDTAFYQNKKNNLIEISSDSEDTTESEDDDSSSSSTCSNSISESEDDDRISSGSSTCSDSDSDSDDDECGSDSEKVHPDPIIETITEPESTNISEVVDILCDDETTSDIKLITVDLGTSQESPSVKSSPERPVDVLSMLYKKTQEQSITVETTIESEASPSDPTLAADSTPSPEPSPAPASAPTSISYTNMSVPELRQLLKEKYKQHPEKHAEIQKLKKAELVYALQTASV